MSIMSDRSAFVEHTHLRLRPPGALLDEKIAPIWRWWTERENGGWGPSPTLADATALLGDRAQSDHLLCVRNATANPYFSHAGDALEQATRHHLKDQCFSTLNTPAQDSEFLRTIYERVCLNGAPIGVAGRISLDSAPHGAFKGVFLPITTTPKAIDTVLAIVHPLIEDAFLSFAK